jgi:hypothetical protein
MREQALLAAADESIEAGRQHDVSAIEMKPVAAGPELHEGIVLRHKEYVRGATTSPPKRPALGRH